MDTLPELSQFTFKTYEKLRYGDTDRQGHVNNAVFSTMLETGRCDILYDPNNPITAPNCTFVIASLTLNFRSEINWPGRVDIGTRVASIGRSSVTMEQALFQDGRCAATATTVVVQMNEATRRSHPLEEKAIAQLSRK
jgi:acyl-CoA thioester hydrolase